MNEAMRIEDGWLIREQKWAGGVTNDRIRLDAVSRIEATVYMDTGKWAVYVRCDGERVLYAILDSPDDAESWAADLWAQL